MTQRHHHYIVPAGPSYGLTGIHHNCWTGSIKESERRYVSSCSLWFAKHGQAELKIGESTYRISAAVCLFVPPNAIVELEGGGPELHEVFGLLFEANEEGLAVLGKEIAAFPWSSSLSAEAEALRDMTNGGNALELLRCQSRFLGLMAELLELRNSEPEESGKRAIEETVRYLNGHYHQEIRIEQLAEQSGLSRWQYHMLFKTKTGLTPVQYLTELRIGRAKELLLESESRLKEIAEQVGFRDEYYFSRRFKQEVGLSPSAFIRKQPRGIRVCSIHTLGDLLALGIVPVGANQSLMGLFQLEEGPTKALEEPLDPGKLAKLRPDIIACPSYAPKKLHDALSAIAPTVLINWEDHLYDRLLKLGKVLNRSSDAKSWIRRYREKASKIRADLSPYVEDGESAAAFVFHREGLYVYGGHNFGHTLYEGLGFAAPSSLRKAMERDPAVKWIKIKPSELFRYDADRVFLAVADADRQHPAFTALLESREWLGLAGANRKRSYLVEQRWGMYDAATLELHLEETARLLKE